MSEQGSPTPVLQPWQQMMELARGLFVTQAIYVAAKLGIADLVEDKPKTALELANATQAHPPSLRRLLLMLSSMGIFAQDAEGRFRQTPLSDALRSANPQSVRNYAMLVGSHLFWRPWGDLRRTIETGTPAFDRVFGAPLFDYLKAHPEDGAIFDAAMTNKILLDRSIVTAYDFSQFKRIVDVGGGAGALLHAILSANPELRGVLYDRPATVANATLLRSGAIANRCEVVGGDFFQSIPEGADAYIASSIIHDWTDEDALKILRNCRRAISPGGKLLLIEAVLKPPNQSDPGRTLDVTVMVILGGRERDEQEFRALLGDAGFSLRRIVPTAGPLSIVESEPV
jgi:SAM-dependent methyltransferase